jgi:hypothetical protein
VWEDEEPLPPHDTQVSTVSTTIGAASADHLIRFRTSIHDDPSSMTVHASGIVPGGNPIVGTLPLVTDAVVPIFTVTDCVALPLICTDELDSVHVGVGVTVGVIAQLRFTVPVNDPVGASARLKLAVCPALIVCEVGEPEAAPIVKPGAGEAAPDKLITCGLPATLSVTVMLPVRLPVALGVKVTDIVQLPPAVTEFPQVFVSLKSPEAVMLLMVTTALPIFTRFVVCAALVVPSG